MRLLRLLLEVFVALTFFATVCRGCSAELWRLHDLSTTPYRR
jgi:hypothetical protein